MEMAALEHAGKILVLNAGSSTIKFRLFQLEGAELAFVIGGMIDRIGQAGSTLSLNWNAEKSSAAVQAADSSSALELIFEALRSKDVLRDASALLGIGHRVVHGGEAFVAPTLITDAVLDGIRAVSALAPLHNPANLQGIEVARRIAPHVPQVAVFDTAFHHTLPEHAFLYALPRELHAQHGVRRYGFHGTSHAYVAGQCAELLSRPLAELNLITLHLGGGASATAIKGGRSVDTSMGFTPLEGLVMGSRCGDLDPALPHYLESCLGLNAEQVDDLLNHGSGLKGLCGLSDMRELEQAVQRGNLEADLAFNMFCYRIRKYIGAYTAVLGHVDAIVFTGGIGENSPAVREKICAGLDSLGFSIDAARNAAKAGESANLHRDDSRSAILMIRTNEELSIARETLALCRELQKR